VRFAGAEYTGVALADFLSDLAKKVQANDATITQFHRLRGTAPAPAPAPEVDADTQLSRAELWRQIEADLDANTTLMVETGISWWDGMYTRLPGGARFEIEMQWGSIGWATPAAFGYSVGLEPDRRRILPADRSGSVQHDPPSPGDPDLPGQQPRIRDRVGHP
jgi:TPP-dependent 2-oxoacid decarboxylase